MRLVCRQLLHLHFCARKVTLSWSFPPGEKKSKEQEEKSPAKCTGSCVRNQSQGPDWIKFYPWDLTLYQSWGEHVL